MVSWPTRSVPKSNLCWQKPGAELKEKALEKRLMEERLHVTLPGKKQVIGHQHPLSMVLDDIKEIFIGMGFDIVEGPEVEYDYYNFEALNIPEGPPRSRHAGHLLHQRQHSPAHPDLPGAGPHHGAKQKPPIRVISPGRVYRSDACGCDPLPPLPSDRGPWWWTKASPLPT